ncbi:MAG: GtrA family protein [Chitinophagaceae bacterium]
MVTFLKAQAAAITGSAIDFLVFTIMAHLIGNTPDQLSIATAIGAFCGGLLNFLIVRKWVFNEGQKGAHIQAGRYILVWAGSILLNASGMYLVTYFTNINHIVARVLVSIVVGVTYNYFLQKRFVFK